MIKIKYCLDYYVLAGDIWSGKFNKHRKLKPSENGLGYLQIDLCKDGKRKSFLVSRLVAEAHLEDYSEDLQVDHINGNRLDNRVENLRMVTHQENSQAFHKPHKNASSKFRGVSWHKAAKKWAAQIRVNGKKIHLGYFIDEKKAARAYDRAAIKNGFALEALNF